MGPPAGPPGLPYHVSHLGLLQAPSPTGSAGWGMSGVEWRRWVPCGVLSILHPSHPLPSALRGPGIWSVVMAEAIRRNTGWLGLAGHKVCLAVVGWTDGQPRRAARLAAHS